MRRFAALSALVAVLVPVVLAGGAAAPAATGSGTGARLQAFGSCSSLLAYAKGHLLPLVGRSGLVGAPGAPAVVAAPEASRAAEDAGAADFSTTNVQEQGVDEPDLVKSNGSTVFVVRADTLFAVDVRGGAPKLVGSMPLPPGGSYELLLQGDRLLVLSHVGLARIGVPGVGVRPMFAPSLSRSTLTEVDVGNPRSMRVVRSLVLDADYVAARLVGTVARIVTVSGMPQGLPFVPASGPTPEAVAASLARNRAVVRSSRIGSWLPSYQVKGRRGQTLLRRPLVQCRDVRRPAVYSGLGLLTVLTVDLRKGLAPIDSDSIVADGRTVYASQDSLYVATQRFLAQPVEAGTSVDPRGMTTTIHKFDIADPTTTRYRGSGTVTGYLMSQWSMSEYHGVLRVASTTEPTWWNPGPQEQSESFVTTLGDRDGALVRLGQVGGLGRGERVYAVRFAGDSGYVVTFRQVDPLYTLDLSTPSRPAVLGELKLQGYSSYLHPLGDGLLLGIGQDATAEGRTLGTHLSLFDVSDLRRPVRLQVHALGRSWSEAESDHHAFLWWGPSRLAVIPVQSYDGRPFAGAVAFRVGRSGIVEAGRVSHDGSAQGGSIRRSLVVGDTLFTISDAGVEATRIATFAGAGWAPFPAFSPTR